MLSGELITAIAGSGGAMVTIGGGVAWIWNKIESRFKAIEDDLDRCRVREEASVKRRAVHVSVIEILWQALERHEEPANSKPLARAKHLLDDLKQMAKE